MDITAPNKPPKVRRRRGVLITLIWLHVRCKHDRLRGRRRSGGLHFVEGSKDLPDYEVLAKYEPPVMTRIHANDGNMIAEFSRERRIYVPFTAIPDQLIHAFLSAEDKTFYQHGGIDIQGILRAVFTNFGSSGGHKVGASTITQQVAKNFLLSSDQTMERKLKEVILSIRIERAFTKKQIHQGVSLNAEGASYRPCSARRAAARPRSSRMAGFLQPDQGEIVIRGQVVNYLPPHQPTRRWST